MVRPDMKESMKNKEKTRLAAIRAIQTAFKQYEVDERADVNEATGIQILSKLAKQRRESIKSYSDANRLDLAATEQAELETIESYLPKQMSPDEVLKLIEDTIAALGATTIKDMGSVMNSVRPQLLGKADMSTVGDIIKKKLSPSK